MPMLIWVAALSGYMHRGIAPEDAIDAGRLRHDPTELERRLKKQREEAFGPRRYEEIKALEAAAREAERRAAELKREQDRLAVIAAAQEAAQIARQARESAYYDAEQHIQLLHLRHALEAFNSAKNVNSTLQSAHLIGLATTSARHRFDDDEEAAALLLLH